MRQPLSPAGNSYEPLPRLPSLQAPIFPLWVGEKSFLKKIKKVLTKRGCPDILAIVPSEWNKFKTNWPGGLAQLGERLTGSQEVSGSIPLFSTKENLETIMVSRFFLIYGKLHKVAFVLNLCWTRGKIAHNFLFPATHFHNFFYIFIISTFCTNALIGKGFFCPFEKAQSKKCIFLSTLSFLRLCWISCWITNSSPLFSRTGTSVVPVPPHRSWTVRSNHANRDTIGGLAFHCQQFLMMFVWFEWKPLSHPAVTFQIPLIQ